MSISLDEFRSVFFSSVEAVLGRDNFSINPDETFENVGMDSLDRMNLLLDLEERLEMDLGELDLGQANTLELLHKKICELKND